VGVRLLFRPVLTQQVGDEDGDAVELWPPWEPWPGLGVQMRDTPKKWKCAADPQARNPRQDARSMQSNEPEQVRQRHICSIIQDNRRCRWHQVFSWATGWPCVRRNPGGIRRPLVRIFNTCPPQAAVVEAGQGHHRFGVGLVPLHVGSSIVTDRVKPGQS